jgi:hypothetical protein
VVFVSLNGEIILSWTLEQFFDDLIVGHARTVQLPRSLVPPGAGPIYIRLEVVPAKKQPGLTLGRFVSNMAA